MEEPEPNGIENEIFTQGLWYSAFSYSCMMTDSHFLLGVGTCDYHLVSGEIDEHNICQALSG